ncbi:hypothetical protein [Planctomicrobium sp. SH527]|uniref:hypothetical protein n=1 Tax=Planctomicrobium sp. SH527 TaxID=3448123 RepID=UPI003F5B4D6B
MAASRKDSAPSEESSQAEQRSVTKHLHETFETGGMSERLYEFLKVELDDMIGGRLARIPGGSKYLEDIRQNTAIGGWLGAKKRRFASRVDFLRFCVAVAKCRIADLARKKFGATGEGSHTHLPPEALENVADPKSLPNPEREICHDLVKFAKDLVEQEQDLAKQAALSVWIENVCETDGAGRISAREVRQTLEENFEVKVPSIRSVARWIEHFSAEFKDHFVEKYGASFANELRILLEQPPAE